MHSVAVCHRKMHIVKQPVKNQCVEPQPWSTWVKPNADQWTQAALSVTPGLGLAAKGCRELAKIRRISGGGIWKPGRLLMWVSFFFPFSQNILRKQGIVKFCNVGARCSIHNSYGMVGQNRRHFLRTKTTRSSHTQGLLAMAVSLSMTFSVPCPMSTLANWMNTVQRRVTYPECSPYWPSTESWELLLTWNCAVERNSPTWS